MAREDEKTPSGNTRKYDNGPNGWTDYDSSGNAVAAGTGDTLGTSGNPYNIDPSFQGPGNSYSELSGSSSSGGYGSGPVSSYQQQLTKYQNMIAEQEAQAKRDALRQAWEGNSQALNSQRSTVSNNYQSVANNLNLLRQQRLPEYLAQKDATSADAASMQRRTEALNALGGRYFSGANRSQMLNIDLQRQNSLQGIQGDQNNFETGVSNQLSEADMNRVAALNDIAEKLSLGEKQYNDGTLSITNQLESTKASGALKAMMDAQAWSDKMTQQGIDNSFRQGQFDQSAKLAELQQQFQQKQLDSQQQAQIWEQQFKEKGFSADEAYRMAQTQLQKDTLAAETAYKNAALALSRSGGSSSVTERNYQDKQNSTSSTNDAFAVLNALASQGKSRTEILNYLNQHSGDFEGVDYDALLSRSQKAFTWDRDADGNWYNTAVDKNPND